MTQGKPEGFGRPIIVIGRAAFFKIKGLTPCENYPQTTPTITNLLFDIFVRVFRG
jgi:hypothetical protein